MDRRRCCLLLLNLVHCLLWLDGERPCIGAAFLLRVALSIGGSLLTSNRRRVNPLWCCWWKFWHRLPGLDCQLRFFLACNKLFEVLHSDIGIFCNTQGQCELIVVAL